MKDIILAIIIQAAVMSFCEVVFFCNPGAKKQVMSGVALSAFLGTLAAYQIAPLASGVFYWIGPMFVGLLGYLAAYSAAGNQPPQGWLVLVCDPTGPPLAATRPPRCRWITPASAPPPASDPRILDQPTMGDG